MSAPSGPRGLRGGIRSRPTSRASPRSRDSRFSRAPSSEHQAKSIRTPHHDAEKSNRTPRVQNHVRHKSERNSAQLSSAILDHAGNVQKSQSQRWRDPLKEDYGNYKKRMNDLYQTLKDGRERERREAIKNGFLADPDKPTSLANAITPVGTCQDFCPEFERVERIVQLMVDGSEKATSSSGEKVPLEALMVKRFRRSAAGYDEQLPSDIRPPAVLKKTLDYLFDEVVGGPESLATVHKFVWDRTRGIRNDFSIQQVTKIADLKIAIECFERIARFHILALHQLSREGDQVEFDHHQEREQLNNTLLSLIYYYDDSRHRLVSPNEAEFRAYCIIFEIQDQRPDLEDRAQNWPRPVLKDPRVQTALKLYAAAANTSDEQGPLRPRTPFTTAQANCGKFWQIVQSNAVSYVMACVAEIYFNLVRSAALEAIWIAYKGKRGGPTKMEDWGLEDLTFALGFDNQDQTCSFCEDHELQVHEKDDGGRFVDLGSTSGLHLRDSNSRRKQIFSDRLVEKKRFRRTLPAVINGTSASQAQSQGFVEGSSEAENASMNDEESLFLHDDTEEEQRRSTSRSKSPRKAEAKIESANPSITANSSHPRMTFGLPSSTLSPIQPASNMHSQIKQTSTPDANPPLQPDSSTSESKQAQSEQISERKSPFSFQDLPKFNFGGSTSTQMSHNITGTGTSRIDTPNDQKSTLFGQPFSTSNTNAGISQTQNIGTAGASSINGASPFLPIDATSKAQTNIKAKEPDILNVKGPSTELKIPTFSFGTSPLFSAVTSEKFDAQPETTNPTPEIGALFKPQSGNRTATPNLTITKSSAQDFSSPNPSSRISAPTTSISIDSPKPIPEQSPVSASHLARDSAAFTPPPSLNPLKEGVIPSSTIPPHAQASSSFPGYSSEVDPERQNTRLATSAHATDATRLDLSSNLSSSNKVSLGSEVRAKPLPSLRQTVLDELSTTMMIEAGGLVELFVQHTIQPIIDASVAQFEDEKSWTDAMKAREFLLARKYWSRWRANAWNLSLKRRGKERRKAFARSIQNPDRISDHRRDVLEQFPFPDAVCEDRMKPHQRAPSTSMLPSPAPSRKRQSLPIGQGQKGVQNVKSERSTKRKREDFEANAERSTPEPSTRGHKRSSTIGASVLSAPPHMPGRSSHRSSVNISQLADGSLLGNPSLSEIRRLAPNARSDTTKTDYFKLKAMGLDPDTPIVPLTRKRTRPDAEINGVSSGSTSLTQARRIVNGDSNDKSGRTPARAAPVGGNDDDDEALFASIRAVKETLADSTSWFKTERQSIERSSTPNTSTSPRSVETSAQRRLREIRERGPTPSRARLRLQAMGDHALIPKGFWDGQGMGLSLHGKDSERANMMSAPSEAPVMGFAAIGMKSQPGYMVNGNAGTPRGEMDELQNQGSSMDDAIEL